MTLAWRHTIPVRSVTFVLTLLTIWLPAFTANARKPPKTDKQIVFDLLSRASPRWPESVAKAFIDRLPERILLPMKNQSRETIASYVTQKRKTDGPVRGAVVSWVSFGYGGGFLCLLGKSSAGHEAVWDSLLPVSVIAPQLEFRDVTGDGRKEIIISGELLEGGFREWCIVAWHADTSWVMAPRLDLPGKHRYYNRLLGKDLQIEHDATGEPARLTLLAPMPAAESESADSVRVFLYRADSRGFLPEE